MKKTLLVNSILLLLSITACSAKIPQTEIANQAYPNPSYPNPTQTEPEQRSPFTEAGVPRVTVEEAKAALDSGEAVIVDVRSADSYVAGHIVGAINIPLTEFENNIANVPLAKDQWIITYCT
jgi:3-mercaptopyruvate sulfurtransferase SseA